MDNREIKLTDFINIAIKRLWILVLAAIIGAGAAVYYSKAMIVPLYQVHTAFLVDTGILTNEEEEIDQLEAQRQVVGSRYQVPSYMKILDTKDFADAVAKKLEENPDKYPLDYEYSVKTLSSAISFSNEIDMESYDMTVVAFSPNDALNIARCIEDYSEEYIVGHKPMAKDTLRVIDHARPSREPINVNTALNVMVGAMLCLAIAFVICFLVEMNDVRIKSETGVTEILGIPVIGAIPEYTSHGSSLYRSYYRRSKKEADEKNDSQNDGKNTKN